MPAAREAPSPPPCWVSPTGAHPLSVPGSSVCHRAQTAPCSGWTRTVSARLPRDLLQGPSPWECGRGFGAELPGHGMSSLSSARKGGISSAKAFIPFSTFLGLPWDRVWGLGLAWNSRGGKGRCLGSIRWHTWVGREGKGGRGVRQGSTPSSCGLCEPLSLTFAICKVGGTIPNRPPPWGLKRLQMPCWPWKFMDGTDMGGA